MNFNDYLKIRNELSCGRQRTTSFATDGFDKEWSDVLAEWLIQIENDCADDVYYIVIGIRKSSRK